MNNIISFFTIKRNIIKEFVLFAFIFIILLSFYLFKQKLYLFDTDDWKNISQFRSFLPIWGSFNPAKVLPETLLPIVTFIGNLIIYPLYHDLVISSHIIYSIILSALIAAYAIFFVKLVNTGKFINKAILCIFTVFILATFCYHDESNRVFLLSNENVTTIFHYTIPVIFNCLAVFYLVSIKDCFTLTQSKIKTTIQALALYYVIFSNLYANVILISYSCAVLLQFLFKRILLKNCDSIRAVIPHLYCSLLWLICVIFEYNGGRAKVIETNLSDYIYLSIEYVCLAYKTINSVLLLIFSVISLIATLTICVYKKSIKIALGGVLTSLIAWAGLIVYLCILGSKTGPGYLLLPATRLVLYFFPLLISFFLLDILLKYYKKTTLTVIVASLIVLIYQFGISMNTIRYTNFHGIYPDLAYAIIEDMHEQLIEETNVDKLPVIIKVPKLQCGSNDNWPLALYGGNGFAKSFYRFGDLDHKVEAKFVVDYSKNVKFGLIGKKVNCVR